jgi:hypothetical protein
MLLLLSYLQATTLDSVNSVNGGATPRACDIYRQRSAAGRHPRDEPADGDRHTGHDRLIDPAHR